MASQVTSYSIEGFLYKLGGRGKTWKKKYVILDGDKINYFKKKGNAKPHGTISLSEARGVRSLAECECEWPTSVTEEYAFGIAIDSRTYYFHSNPEEGKVSEWKTKTRDIVEKHGHPDPKWQDDVKGNPEGSKSYIARKVVSVTSQVTKEAIKYAPVDGRIKNGIAAGADMIKAQADADPNAGVGERLALGVGGAAGVAIGVSGVGGVMGGAMTKIVAKGTSKIVGKGAEKVAEYCEDNDI